MRGEGRRQRAMLTVVNLEQRVAPNHPLRRIKPVAESALARLSKTFDRMYSAVGRPSIPPERLLKASLLMALYTVRSERLFCEQLEYNLLFRWFLDLELDEPSFDHSSFSANRARLLKHEVAGVLLWCSGTSPRAGAAFERTLHGRRHAGRGVGFA